MSMQLRCSCGVILRSKDSLSGKKVTCPKCGTQLQVQATAPRAVSDGRQGPVGASTARAGVDKPSSPTMSVRDSLPPPSQPTMSANRWPAHPSSPSSPRTQSKLNSQFSYGLWIVVGLGGMTLLSGLVAALYFIPTTATNSTSQSKDKSTASSTPSQDASTRATASSGAQPSPISIAGRVHKENSATKVPILNLVEEFVRHASLGNTDAALKLVSEVDFDQRQKDGPNPSWEAIVKPLEASKVLSHLRSKTLESTPLDEAFRHWHILGETVYQGKPAVLLRYYSDPEYPGQLLRSTDTLESLTKIMSFEEFQSVAADLAFRAKDRNRAAPPIYPDTFGFLPPRFGWLMLVMDSNSKSPKIVDVVNVLGQVPMSQIGGKIYLDAWQVITIKSGSNAEFEQRINKANAAGRKAFSIYGVVPSTADLNSNSEPIPAPALWFRPPESSANNPPSQSDAWTADWLAKQSPSRTTRLVRIADALSRSSPEVVNLIADFQSKHPKDFGADLAVLSFAMTALEPRMPEPLLPVIDRAAESLYKTYPDPVLLFVRGLVQEAKGNDVAAESLMQQANRAGFVSMRMLRKPFEQAIAQENKGFALAALKEIANYWSMANLDKSTSAESQFRDAWRVASDRARGVHSDLVQRDPISGGLGRRSPGNRPESSPLGSMAPQALQPGTGRAESLPPSEFPTGPNRDQVRPGGFPPGPRGPNFGPPPGSGEIANNVRFILRSKSSLDAGTILETLKQRLKTGNLQMSSSGNNATITLGFSGPLDEALQAIDFGKVVQKDEANRSITIELP